MKRRVILGAVVLATVIGTLGLASSAEAFWRCRRYSTTYVVAAPVYPVCYEPAAPVYYQPAYYQPVQPAYYAPAAYEVPVTTYYAPAYTPVVYQAPSRERVKVRVDVPNGPDYKYDYKRTRNYVRVRESY